MNHSVNAPHFRVYPNGTLSISAATADNEGNYLCKADNGVGEAISKLAHVGINGERRERDDDHLEGRMQRREMEEKLCCIKRRMCCR